MSVSFPTDEVREHSYIMIVSLQPDSSGAPPGLFPPQTSVIVFSLAVAVSERSGVVSVPGDHCPATSKRSRMRHMYKPGLLQAGFWLAKCPAPLRPSITARPCDPCLAAGSKY